MHLYQVMNPIRCWICINVVEISVIAVCELEKDAGTCSKYVNMWAYDRQQGKCIRFWYGGCEGNANRFDTEQQCQETCVNPKGIGNSLFLRSFP